MRGRQETTGGEKRKQRTEAGEGGKRGSGHIQHLWWNGCLNFAIQSYWKLGLGLNVLTSFPAVNQECVELVMSWVNRILPHSLLRIWLKLTVSGYI